MRYAYCVLFIVYLSGASGNPRGGEVCWCVPPVPWAGAALAPLYAPLPARSQLCTGLNTSRTAVAASHMAQPAGHP